MAEERESLANANDPVPNLVGAPVEVVEVKPKVEEGLASAGDGFSHADDDSPDWDTPLLKAAREKADIIAEHPRSGCKKWWPIYLELFRVFVMAILMLFLYEGFFMSMLVSDTAEDLEKDWFWGTLGGSLPFYKENSCYVTMFDQLCFNVISFFIFGIIVFVFTNLGNYTVTSMISDEGVTMKQARRSFGFNQILFKYPGVKWERTACWRGLFGPLYAPSTALWTGALRLRCTDQRYQVMTGKAGASVTESFRSFPAWFAVYCADKRAKAESLLQNTETVTPPRGVCCNDIENSWCMCPIRRSNAVNLETFDGFVDEFEAKEGAPKYAWRGTHFAWWRRILLICALSWTLEFMDITKPNSFGTHWMTGNDTEKIENGKTVKCGKSFGDAIGQYFSVVAMAIISAIWYSRGHWQTEVQLFDSCIFIRSGRTAKKILWKDVQSVHTVPCCNGFFYRPSSLVLQIEGYDEVKLDDAIRTVCSCCCCCFCAFDNGICCMYYINAICAQTKSNAPGIFMEVPSMAAHIETCAQFSSKFENPTVFTSKQEIAATAI